MCVSLYSMMVDSWYVNCKNTVTMFVLEVTTRLDNIKVLGCIASVTYGNFPFFPSVWENSSNLKVARFYTDVLNSLWTRTANEEARKRRQLWGIHAVVTILYTCCVAYLTNWNHVLISKQLHLSKTFHTSYVFLLTVTNSIEMVFTASLTKQDIRETTIGGYKRMNFSRVTTLYTRCVSWCIEL